MELATYGFAILLGLIAGALGYCGLARLDKRARNLATYETQLTLAAVHLGYGEQWAGIQAEIQDPEDIPADILRRRQPLLRKDWNLLSLSYSDDLVLPYSLIETLSLLQQYRLKRVLALIEPSITSAYSRFKWYGSARDIKTNKFVKDPFARKT